ncbi:MAG TPA: apolipoprotein N-acyltransferase [Polyangiaceae bacterium LLY-WYZ-15_(1-7)]|nr:apolipoprotein N-acyltransferase [Myxococcales bacterium]MAT28516.1 apolipoprotein N-acyltransferase [Sandaracinus sp.]HJL06760.1 apolipoprotein N-acyltransferase [Polyangiaceae bacterium LLY-WYZ-15_(1-7)]MBJ71641.1 apolipoprotein N-acyltransferase [Sandaracinus sp.]HJL09182.1 apolipoprotein N-acyltransferase [Polyangiaceae bacterium LLY-WYZ-15_(1-7)]
MTAPVSRALALRLPAGLRAGWLARPGLRAAVACAGGGALFALSAPPRAAVWGPWLAFVPFLFAARALRAAPRRVAFGAGLLGGVVFAGLAFRWLPHPLEHFHGVAPAWGALLLALFALWTALPWGLWLLLVARGPREGALSILWPALCWAPLGALWPTVFPHTPVLGLVDMPAFAQLAELGGVALVETPPLIVAALLVAAARVPSRRARVAHVGGALALVALVGGLGALRIASLDARRAAAPTLRVGVIQPNGAVRPASYAAHAERLHRASARAAERGAELLLWPEAGAYPFSLRRSRARLPGGVRAVQRDHALPTLFGATTYEDGLTYNSMLFVDAAGALRGRFDKNVLFPFGERVPFVDRTTARELLPDVAHHVPGTAVARFAVRPGAAAGPLICYEDLFAPLARRVAAQPGGVDFLTASTIDTWFGDTAAPWQHLALARFRAIEHRVPLVRSVAAGPSSVVDAAGRVRAARPVRAAAPEEASPELLVVPLRLARNTAAAPTLYARGGHLYPEACALAALAILLLRRRRRTSAAAH